MKHHLHELFSSIQGEGRNAGIPATFVRYATCNLSCPWCDTHKTVHYSFGTEEIVDKAKKRKNELVVITGGEPTVQAGLYELAGALKSAGFKVALETNALTRLEDPSVFDYVAASPKAIYAVRYKADTILDHADEVRIVAEKENIDGFCREMRSRIRARHYYISPLDEKGKIHYRRATELMNKLNADCRECQWALSVQLHKILGMK